MSTLERGPEDQHGEYELWDTESGNAVGAYDTLGAALRDVAETVRQYGEHSPEVRSLALLRLDGPHDGATQDGDELVRWALAFARKATETSAGR